MQGRGATEIDLIEVMPGPPGKLPICKNALQRPYSSMTLQVGKVNSFCMEMIFEALQPISARSWRTCKQAPAGLRHATGVGLPLVQEYHVWREHIDQPFLLWHLSGGHQSRRAK